MLNLGLQNVNTTPSITISDVLSSEIVFKEAYQEFINYMNVCEIVTKAKVSEERMNFASDLLGRNVSDIAISVEALTETIDKAWKGFLNFWSTIYKWVRDHISDLIDRIKNLFKKKTHETIDFTAPISTDDLKRIQSEAKNIIVRYDFVNDKGKIWLLHGIMAKSVMITDKFASQVKITTFEEAAAWMIAAKSTVAALDSVVEEVSKHTVDKEINKVPDKLKNHKNYKGIVEWTKGENKRWYIQQMAVKRYVMKYFPSVINKIKTAIQQLSKIAEKMAKQ